MSGVFKIIQYLVFILISFTPECLTNKKRWLSPVQSSIPTPKPNIHRTKVMLCVWWDLKGIL